MKRTIASSRSWFVIRGVAVAVAMVAGVVVMMMWLMGVFHPKVGTPAPTTTAPAGRPAGDLPLAEARTIRVPGTETAAGTIRAVHEAAVASKLLAKVAAVLIKAGDPVRKGQVLVQLDDADVKARKEQAAAALEAAKATRDQAKIEYDRVQKLFQQDSAARIELDRVTTSLKSAEAEWQRADHMLKEAETILAYSTITSPMDGIVIDKQVEVGDTVKPAQVLVALYDPTRMQLIARVRESLAHRLRVGQGVPVRVDALAMTCEGQISEIVPEAESASRTFSVKVTGPCPPGVYGGMFGRLMIPLEEEKVLVIPRLAVRRVGQLDIVEVADRDVLRRRAVQLGRIFGENVEVLSGLREGERVALAAGV